MSSPLSFTSFASSTISLAYIRISASDLFTIGIQPLVWHLLPFFQKSVCQSSSYVSSICCHVSCLLSCSSGNIFTLEAICPGNLHHQILLYPNFFSSATTLNYCHLLRYTATFFPCTSYLIRDILQASFYPFHLLLLPIKSTIIHVSPISFAICYKLSSVFLIYFYHFFKSTTKFFPSTSHLGRDMLQASFHFSNLRPLFQGCL
jgi:hypothetical protein